MKNFKIIFLTCFLSFTNMYPLNVIFDINVLIRFDTRAVDNFVIRHAADFLKESSDNGISVEELIAQYKKHRAFYNPFASLIDYLGEAGRTVLRGHDSCTSIYDMLFEKVPYSSVPFRILFSDLPLKGEKGCLLDKMALEISANLLFGENFEVSFCDDVLTLGDCIILDPQAECVLKNILETGKHTVYLSGDMAKEWFPIFLKKGFDLFSCIYPSFGILDNFSKFFRDSKTILSFQIAAVCSDDGLEKNFFKEVLGRFGLSGESCVFIGLHRLSCHLAKQLGMASVMFDLNKEEMLWKKHLMDALREVKIFDVGQDFFIPLT